MFLGTYEITIQKEYFFHLIKTISIAVYLKNYHLIKFPIWSLT